MGTACGGHYQVFSYSAFCLSLQYIQAEDDSQADEIEAVVVWSEEIENH